MSKKRPVHTIKRGNIEAAIWENNSENSTFFNVTITRTYKDGDELKSISSFGASDLLKVARVTELAEAYIYNQSK